MNRERSTVKQKYDLQSRNIVVLKSTKKGRFLDPSDISSCFPYNSDARATRSRQVTLFGTDCLALQLVQVFNLSSAAVPNLMNPTHDTLFHSSSPKYAECRQLFNEGDTFQLESHLRYIGIVHGLRSSVQLLEYKCTFQFLFYTVIPSNSASHSLHPFKQTAPSKHEIPTLRSCRFG